MRFVLVVLGMAATTSYTRLVQTTWYSECGGPPNQEVCAGYGGDPSGLPSGGGWAPTDKCREGIGPPLIVAAAESCKDLKYQVPCGNSGIPNVSYSVDCMDG